MRGPSIDVLLGRALVASAAAAGARIEIGGSTATAWHSATFNGTRHRIDAQAAAHPATSGWLEALDPLALSLPGHLVADVAVTAVDREADRLRLRFEAVTVARH